MEISSRLIQSGLDVNTADLLAFRTNQYDDCTGEWSQWYITSMSAEEIQLHFPTAEIVPYWSTDRLADICPKQMKINDKDYFIDLSNDVQISAKTKITTTIYSIAYKTDDTILVKYENPSLRVLLFDTLIYLLGLIRASQQTKINNSDEADSGSNQ